MHRREILHQDIKPGNIMIDNNGEVTIIDFGSCYSKGIAEIAAPLDDPGILGTAGYSAPEVVITGKSTVQSEVFSLMGTQDLYSQVLELYQIQFQKLNF